jgi:hypothetical protein
VTIIVSLLDSSMHGRVKTRFHHPDYLKISVYGPCDPDDNISGRTYNPPHITGTKGMDDD